jgi:putative ABC transport system substrate-binding protein
MIKSINRCLIVFAILAIVITACAPAPTATPSAPLATAVAVSPKPTAAPSDPASASSALAPIKSDWFAVYSKAAANWNITPDPGDVNKFAITPKNPSGNEKKVFVLYPRKSSAYDTAISTLLDVFYNKKVAATFTIVNFDRKNDKGLAALALAESLKSDLIFSMGSESTDFIYLNYRGKSIPVVTVCSKDPVLLNYIKDYNTGSGSNFAFTSLNVPIEVQMAYLKQLRPNLRNIAVMFADSNTSSKETQVKPLKDASSVYKINVLDVVVLQDAKAKQELEAAMPGVIAEMQKTDPTLQDSIFWITGSTPVFNEIATINRMAGNVPVLSVVPDVVKEGDASAVLSIGVSFESNAYIGALYGTDILLGAAKAGDLKVGVVSPPDIAINFKRAKAIGLKVPFSFFESASFIYNYDGKTVRKGGEEVRQP